jgi:hypothetical protein
MSWAANRKTKREEDKAYSLLGIFKIHMPLIYGEGSENAFNRLKEEIDRRLWKEEGQNNMSQPDPAFKAIQELLLDQKKREEERMASEARKIAEAKAANAARKLKEEEHNLAKLQQLIIQHNKEQLEREKRAEAARQAEAQAKAAAELRAAEERKRADEKAKEIKQAAEMAKLEAEIEAAKKAAEEKEKHEKELEEAKKKAAEFEAAKKKFEDEVKALRPGDDMLKPPIKFKDAIGRKFSFPWHICKTWKVRRFAIHRSCDVS